MNALAAPRALDTAARWSLRLGIGLLVLVVVLALAAWLLLRTIDLDAVTNNVEGAVQKATGRSFSIGGRPEITLLPKPRVVLRDIALGNPAGASRPQMLTVRRIGIGVSFVAALSGQGLGVRIEVDEPDVLLEIDKKGESNFRLLIPARDFLRDLVQALGVVGQYARFDSVQVSNLRVGFRDERTGFTHGAALRTVHAAVAGQAVEVEARADGGPEALLLEASVGTVTDEAGKLGVRAKLRAPGLTAAASGDVHPQWPSDGTDIDIELNLSSARRLAAAAGLTIPEMPKLALKTHAAGRDGGLRLEPLDLTVDSSRVAGFVEFRERRSRPFVDARLEGDLIDLATLPAGVKAKPEADKQQAAGAARLIPDPTLLFPALRLADTTLDLKAKRMLLPSGVALSAVSARLVLDGGRLTADPLRVGFAGSQVAAKLIFDASSASTATVDTTLRARGFGLDALQAALPDGVHIAGGKVDIDLHLAAHGASLRPLLASLNGQVRIELRDAKISGALASAGGSLIGGLVRSLNPYVESDKSQHLKCAVVNVPLRAGVLSSKNSIALETDKIVGTVSGQVDFGKETLDLRLQSEAVDSLGPGLTDFAGAGQLTGSFAQPSLAVNAKGTARLGATTAAAIATGGLSLLAGSVIRAATPPHPCAIALKGAK